MHRPYVAAALAGELAELRDAAAGTRNVQLFRTAARLYQFVEAGELDREDLAQQLHATAHALGLGSREVRDTLRSAERRARGHVASIPDGTAGAPLDLHAPEPAEPPAALWQERATSFCDWAARRLWGPEGRRAFDWLRGRGLSALTIIRAELGYNPEDRYELRSAWGLPSDVGDDGRPRRVWIPRGIVLPWRSDGSLWRIAIRRPLPPAQRADEAPYVVLPGSANALYGASGLARDQIAVLVEGVFDALAISQVAGDLVTAVAAGTTGARRMRWILRLSACHRTLLAFDADGGGEAAAAYWQAVLGARARRWRPLIDDPAAMLAAGMELRAWAAAGIVEALDDRGEE